MLVILPAAGCIGGGTEDLTPAAAPPVAPAVETPVAAIAGDAVGTIPGDLFIAPEWTIGDWWTFHVEHPNLGLSYDATWVVYNESADSYFLGVNDPVKALPALFLHHPAVGAIRRTDLAHDVHGAPVAYVAFPVEGEKRWTAEIRGLALDFVATPTTARVPGEPVPVPALHVVASSDGRTTYDITYVPAIRWFSEFTFWHSLQPDTPNTHYTLTRAGRDHRGEVTGILYADAYAGHRSVSVPPSEPAAPPFDTFTIAEGWPRTVFGAFLSGGPGLVGVTFQGPGSVVEFGGPAGANQSTTLVTSDTEAAPGAWSIHYELAAPRAFAFAEAFLVRYEPATLTPS
ncbi:MAG: hypothetical protein ACT4PT_07980 [Methanobacteriota archaeon]